MHIEKRNPIGFSIDRLLIGWWRFSSSQYLGSYQDVKQQQQQQNTKKNTFMILSGRYRLVTVHTHGDSIVLSTGIPGHQHELPNIALSHIILRLSQTVLIMPRTWVESATYTFPTIPHSRQQTAKYMHSCYALYKSSCYRCSTVCWSIIIDAVTFETTYCRRLGNHYASSEWIMMILG